MKNCKTRSSAALKIEAPKSTCLFITQVDQDVDHKLVILVVLF